MVRTCILLAASAVYALGAAPKPVVKAQAPAVSDARIEQVLKDKLAKSKIGANGFKFRVQGGIVYWDGTANVIQHKGAATRMAKSSGAKAVVNNIQISAAAKQTASDNLAKGRRRAQVKRGEPRT